MLGNARISTFHRAIPTGGSTHVGAYAEGLWSPSDGPSFRRRDICVGLYRTNFVKCVFSSFLLFVLFLYYEQNKSKIVENRFFEQSINSLNSNLPLKLPTVIFKPNIAKYLYVFLRFFLFFFIYINGSQAAPNW